MKEYFKIGTEEWKITVKWSLTIGLILGLISGLNILLEIL